jgi:hypothetical protein
VCIVTSAEFASWFEQGTPTLNGAVRPANSVEFPDEPNCSFYQWAQQMFLWVTSPLPSDGGAEVRRIFDSAAFFDLSPPGPAPDRERTLIPHRLGAFRNFHLRSAKVGPRGLPTIVSQSGQILEVERSRASDTSPASVRAQDGRLVPVLRAAREADGRIVLFDRNEQVINSRTAPQGQAAQPLTRSQLNNVPLVRRLEVSGVTFFVDGLQQLVNVEQGQAFDFGVLQAQTGSLVYYTTSVNDVFAYLRTAIHHDAISPRPTRFPTTQSELNRIVNFAASNGRSVSNGGIALAVELKSAWVEAEGLPEADTYITTMGTIPTYDTSNPNRWVRTGEKTVRLALVGMHVVGSARNHPEMIWATFEHFRNAPNAQYAYERFGERRPGDGVYGAFLRLVPRQISGRWLFAENSASGPFNTMHMRVEGEDIVSVPGHTISPSNTIRTKPWGAAWERPPNPLRNSVQSNSEVISINNSVHSRLPNGDVRQNYFMLGATWTIGGQRPDGRNQVGTSMLANSTIETYQQGRNETSAHNSTNCFSCHRTNEFPVSHVFESIRRLF